MTRKHFFTTIAAILTAPFIVKSEPEPAIDDESMLAVNSIMSHFKGKDFHPAG
jgi:hypothetical protein